MKPQRPANPSIDRYRLRRVLGRGGMGVVYLAQDTLLGRDVALKVVHDEVLGAGPERLIGLFQREARILAGLNHPGITQLFDYSGLYSTRLYLVMEYVPGRDLASLLGDAGAVEPDLAARIGVAAAGTLAYAHGRGVIHQDLKPENILVTADGVLKLTDFGIARRVVAGHEGESGELNGTPAYMAPERIRGEAADPRADIFSLAATLYTLASGHQLVEDDEPLLVLQAIASGDFPPLSERAPHVPHAIAEVVMRALAADPRERYADALAFGRALAAAAQTTPPDLEAVPRVAALSRLVSESGISGDAAPRKTTDAWLDAPSAPGPGTTPTVAAGDSAPLATVAADPARAATAAVTPGELPLLQDRFQLLRKVGRGTLGELWEARDTLRDGAPVAVKIFRPARGASVDEFKAEFRALATLRHPNWVAIRDFGLLLGPSGQREHAFYTMDWVDGVDLRQATADAPVETILGLLVQLARVLMFLHDATGRPHLDVKPENVLVVRDEDGQPRIKLTDPGNLAEKLRSILAGDRGALPYAAPETLRGFAADRAADLYGFGVTAFEVLAGRRPLQAPTSELLRSAHLHEEPPDLTAVRPEVAEPIAEVVRQLLAKAPAQRPASAEAWITAVNRVVVPPYPVETRETQRGRLSSGPFVGRQAALQALLSRYRALAEPASDGPRVWIVEGEPGVGKGRMLQELRRAAQLDGALVVGSAPAEREGRSLGSLLPWFRSARRILGLHHPAVTPIAGAIDRILGDRADEAGPRAASGPTLDATALARMLVAAATRPTVLTVRDADRLDPLSRLVVGQVARELSAAALEPDDMARRPPLLVVATAAPGGLDALAEDELVRAGRVTVPAMSTAEVAAMLRSVFGSQPLPDAKLDDLRRLTGGVPRDVLEVLWSLLEGGDLVFERGRWRMRAGAQVPLPRSAEDALARRLGALSEAERAVLEALAVHERAVPSSVIDALAGRVDGPVSEVVQALVERTLLQRVLVEDVVSLEFMNERVREALLREMPAAAREERHREAAEWLETRPPGVAVVEALARHWTLGGRPDRALSFLMEAAERSREAGDPERALQWYRRALEILPRSGLGVLRRLKAEATILTPLGECERAAGQSVEAEAHFSRLVEVGRDLEDDAMVGQGLDRLAVLMIETGRLEEAMGFASERLELAERMADRRAQAMALRLIGVVWRDMEGPHAGIPDLERAVEVAGDAPELADVRARLGVTLSYTYTQAGSPEDGLRWALQALETARAEGIEELEVGALINASMAHFVSGRPDRSLRSARDALALAERHGLRVYYTYALGNVGDSLRVLGRFDEAEEHLRTALRESYRIGATDAVVGRLVELATLAMDQGAMDQGAMDQGAMDQGAPDRALPYLREAWRLQPSLRSPRSSALVGLAELRLRLWATPDEAVRSCDVPDAELLADAAAWGTTLQDPTVEVQATALIATARLRAGEPEAAWHAAERAVAIGEALPPPGLLQHPAVVLGMLEVFTATGHHEQARALRVTAAAGLRERAALIEDEASARSYREAPLHRALLASPDA